LSEPQARKKNREGASEVGGRSPSRSKADRIRNKMLRSNSAGLRSTKRVLFRGARKKRRSIVEQSEKYTLAVRARGV
jgi:hypothetical protein